MKRILPVLLAAVIFAGSFSPALAATKSVSTVEASETGSDLPPSRFELILWVRFLNENPDGFTIEQAGQRAGEIHNMVAPVPERSTSSMN